MLCKNQNTEPSPSPAPDFRERYFTFEQVNVISLFQKLWSQLAVFTRAYINTAIEGSPRAVIDAERLLDVATDFRSALYVFYGPVIADRFNSLFINFIAKSTNVIEGFLSNRQEIVNQSVINWYDDADELARFLASINLYWDELQWRSLLYQFIRLKIQMITSLIARDYRRETQIYDRVFDLTTTMGSYMATGLITQQFGQTERTQPSTPSLP